MGFQMNPIIAIAAVILMMYENNTRIASYDMVIDDKKDFWKMIGPIIIFSVCSAFAYFAVTETFNAFNNAPSYHKTGITEYIMLSLTIIIIILWGILIAWGTVSAIKWIVSKHHYSKREMTKIMKVTCDENENNSYQETSTTVLAQILKVEIIKQDECVVTLGYADLKSTVTIFRRFKKLKKGDKIEALLVERRYQNGRGIRKLFIK
jgi:hypothetical protein